MTIIGFISSQYINDEINIDKYLKDKINTYEEGGIQTIGFARDGVTTEKWQDCQLILVDDAKFKNKKKTSLQ